MKSSTKKITAVFVLVLACCGTFSAQPNQFGYQGNLNNGGAPANGNYDFEFVLFDALNGGNQVGSLLSRNNVAVANGTFAVQLDFGASFPGAARFLEIRVRPAGQPGITILTPRQPIDSSPYAIKSLNADDAATASNALQLGGVAANQFVVTTDPRMTDARTPTAGSGSYIQNSGVLQAASNFNISGNGTVGGTLLGNIVRANTQFNIGNSRVLSIDNGLSNLYLGQNSGNLTMTGTANTFLGNQTGSSNTTGFSNTFVGNTGGVNTTGNENSFFGYAAGSANSTGNDNSFFGRSAGHNNSTGSSNSFFGFAAGNFNTTAGSNAFFGYRSGYNNSGGGNSFFGARAGEANTTGLTNSFFGVSAGESNTSGQNNAFFGANAGAANTTALGNSFFGANAGAANVAQFNSFFGVSSGLVNTTGFNNSFFGTVTGVANTTGASNSFFGHWAGHDNTTGNSNAFFGAFAGEATTNGDSNSFFGRSAGELTTTGNGNTFVGFNAGNTNTSGSNNMALGSGATIGNPDLTFATAIGPGSRVNNSNQIVIGREADFVSIPGLFGLQTFAAGANTPICGNFGGLLGICLSSLRYKTDVETFTSGLDLVRRLRPISFSWKEDGTADVGFGAEEVNEIEPRLVVRGRKGTIEGVKYGQITTVLVNAVNEQQAEIEELRRQVRELKALVCAQNPSVSLCDK